MVGQTFTIYSALFMATSLIALFGAILSWQRRSVKGGHELMSLLLSVGFWSFWLIFETAATTVNDKIYWAKFAYIGAASTPVLYLFFVLRFVGKGKLLNIYNILLFTVIPLFTIVIAFTNEKHLLLWSGFSAISPETNLMEYFHGIWFWIGYMSYNYLLLLISTIYLFSFIVSHPSKFKSQGWLVLIASLIPWSASVIYLSGKNPVYGLDLVPISMIISGTLFTIAILYTKFLNLVPVARKTLVEILSDGILVLDDQNRIQDINESAISYLGLTGKEVFGVSFDMAGIANNQLINGIISPESYLNIEVNNSRSSKTFEVSKKKIKDQAESRLIIIRDVTDMINFQRVIKAGEERYRNLYGMFRLMSDNMSDMLWAKDLNKNFIFINRATCQNLLFAQNTDEPIGRNHLYFAQRERLSQPNIPNWYDFGEQSEDSDQIIIDTNQPGHFEEFGNVRGQFIFLDVQKAPIFDESGKTIGIVGSARDITKNKKSEADILTRDRLLDAIARATARLVQGNDLIKGINGALELIGRATRVHRVYIFENHNHPDHHLPLMSQRYEWTDGSVASEINNTALQNVPYELFGTRLYEVLSGKEVLSGIVREFPERERKVLENQGIKSILLAPVFIDDGFWGFIGFDDCYNERIWSPIEEKLLDAAANNIGAAYIRKKNQDELIVAKEQAEESDRLKSAFLATMNHELRTPINHILGFSELILSDAMPDDNKSFASSINISGKNLLDIVEDIFDLALAEHANVKVKLHTFRLMEHFMEIKSIFDQLLQNSDRGDKIQLIYKPETRLLSKYITMDRSKVSQVLINIFKNALKFTNEGSIEFGFSSESTENITFYIKDSGIGIPKEKQKLIFEYFRQGDDSPTRNYGGIGIGLSICSKISKILNGDLSVFSENGEGSTFKFTIPVELSEVG